MPSQFEKIEELLKDILAEVRRFNTTVPLLETLTWDLKVVNDLEEHDKSVKVSASRARNRWERSQDKKKLSRPSQNNGSSRNAK